MANVNGPFGLRPMRHQTGGKIGANEYSIASGYATSIYTGDVVERTGTGRNIAQAAAGNGDNIGVFAGCRYVDQHGKQVFSQYWPANQVATEVVAFVYDDPNIVFEAQCDTLAEGDEGALADWVVGTGSIVTGDSGLTVESSSTATTGKSLRIMKLKETPENEYGAYAKAEVMFAEHVLSGSVSGVGGV